ncbi:mechanosensitive ion channel family protein [Tanticharoenia sakaeratensis]|uniref:mechanosensitive ion channel family protein n=1 Tax=Tanticharoenia sakaeratensis TaxID=444053 RepID=UPI000A03FBB1
MIEEPGIHCIRSRSFVGRLAFFFLAAFIVVSFQCGIAVSAQAAPATSATPSAPLSRQEAQQLLDVLNDPKQRDAFVHTLTLMTRGLPATTTTPSAATQKIEPVLDLGLTSLRHQAVVYAQNFLGIFANLAIVLRWARVQIADPTARHMIFEAFTGAFAIILVALIVEYGLVFALRGPLVRLTQRAQAREIRRERKTDATVNAASGGDDSRQIRADDQRRQVETLRFLARIPYAFGHFLLKILPVAAFLGIVCAATWLISWSARGTTVTLILAESYAVARMLYLFVETGLAPRSPTIRLIPAGNATAHLVTRWWNVLVAAPAVVVCLSMLGEVFELSPRGTEAMIRAIVLAEHIMIAAFIWRIRHIVASALQPSSAGAHSIWNFIGTAARLWWIPAIFLDISLWFVWAAQLRGGYMWIWRTTGITIGILVVSRVLAVLLYGWQDHFFRVNPALAARMPELQQRADRYYPFARAALTGSLIFLTIVAITEAWGLHTVEFFLRNTFGSRLLGAAITMIVAVTVAVAVWEIVNVLLNRQLNRFESSNQATRATRLRTVMPIMRTVLLAVIVIIVTVTTLSQIGINVTPVLTGAGILGAAIAFGSQSLVKDFITGFFMLVEDAIQVGDWVTTGGVSGTVENLSIRTVKVRDIDGDLHIIPFSSVSSIANTARGYNQIVVRQQVDLSENLPRVVAIMAGVVKEMREDPIFEPMIYSDFNDLGVDQSDSGGATLLGAIRTAPMMKWKVKREFYRRVANRFAAASVKFYTPTSYYTTPPGVPMHVLGEQPGAPADAHPKAPDQDPGEASAAPAG